MLPLNTPPSFDVRAYSLAETYLQYSSIRDARLFTHFLPEGYKLTTLSSVGKEQLEAVLMAKLKLGMIITLIDDYADNPRYQNSELLDQIYLVIERKKVVKRSNAHPSIMLAQILVSGLFSSLQELPGYDQLCQVFQFDLQQIILANRYSEIIGRKPCIANIRESRYQGPYNMGMVGAGMIDLMGSPDANLSQVGSAREVFILGQRMGRICNVLTTFQREKEEGDFTNELAIQLRCPTGARKSYRCLRLELMQEFESLGEEIAAIPHPVPFDLAGYLLSLYELLNLHKELKGVI